MTNKKLRKKYWLLTGKELIFLINKTFKKEIKSDSSQKRKYQ